MKEAAVKAGVGTGDKEDKEDKDGEIPIKGDKVDGVEIREDKVDGKLTIKEVKEGGQVMTEDGDSLTTEAIKVPVGEAEEIMGGATKGEVKEEITDGVIKAAVAVTDGATVVEAVIMVGVVREFSNLNNNRAGGGKVTIMDGEKQTAIIKAVGEEVITKAEAIVQDGVLDGDLNV